jgi:hypothetical protein
LLFLGAAGCVVPSLSRTSRIVESKSIPTVHFFGSLGLTVPSLSQVQVEVLKVKYPNSSLFLVLQVVLFHHCPKYSRIVESKSIPTVCFSGAAGLAVPSLSQLQVELLKVKYPNSSLFWLNAG